MSEISRVLRDFARREGFDVAWSRPNGELGLTRPASQEGLFEQVWVNFAGAKQEAVTTYAAVSVAWGRGTKGLAELEVVRELATVPGRGYAEIETPRDLQRWTQALRAHLPQQLGALVKAKGSTLLERTQVARESALALASLLPQSGRVEEIRRWAAARATDEDRQCASRLADFPGVVTSEDERELYELAALIIAGAAKVAPGAAEVLGANLLAEQEPMWHVQLFVDLLRRMRTREGRETPAPPVSG